MLSNSDNISTTNIGTPGTINKWIAAKKLRTSHLKILVFDEVDHMLAENNEQLFVKKEELSLDSVKQYKVNLPDELSKIMVIKDKIMELGQKVGQTIIFVKTRKTAVRVQIREDGETNPIGRFCFTIDSFLTEELGKQPSISEKDDSPSGVIVTNVELLPVCIVFSFPIPILLWSCRLEKNARWGPEPIKTKQDWHERFKNIRFGKKGVQEADKVDDPTKCQSYGKDLVMSSRGSSHVREKTGINFSIVKLLVLRDKEDKIDVEFGTDENNIATAPPRRPPYGGGSNRGEPRGNGPAKIGAPPKPLPIETPTIFLNELNRITDKFGTKSLVGEGSYGRVFYGKLSAGEEAAVKKLDTSSSPEPDNDFTGHKIGSNSKRESKSNHLLITHGRSDQRSCNCNVETPKDKIDDCCCEVLNEARDSCISVFSQGLGAFKTYGLEYICPQCIISNFKKKPPKTPNAVLQDGVSGKPTVLSFRAYSMDQIIMILKQRLMALPYTVFQPQAFELCSRKVAASFGDMRKALGVQLRGLKYNLENLPALQILLQW
ncbi:hypothetical protein L2E82_50407 [Cichorium intybus]|nr:hypothetical protein L2E82_50407 [Cichorium intybus]